MPLQIQYKIGGACIWMKISKYVQNKETKTALILEPWGVNEITSDEM